MYSTLHPRLIRTIFCFIDKQVHPRNDVVMKQGLVLYPGWRLIRVDKDPMLLLMPDRTIQKMLIVLNSGLSYAAQRIDKHKPDVVLMEKIVSVAAMNRIIAKYPNIAFDIVLDHPSALHLVRNGSRRIPVFIKIRKWSGYLLHESEHSPGRAGLTRDMLSL